MPTRSPATVLITGAEGALGSKVVERFLKTDCRVIGTYFQGPTDKLPHSREVAWLQMNASDAKSIRAGLTSLDSKGIAVDALIHCAGGFRYSHMDQVSEDDIEFLINTNLRSSLLMVREVLPGMKNRGFGRIVLVSSRATFQPTAGMGPYAATKAGLNAIVAAVADETRPHDININAVLPTMIDTPANRRDMPSGNYSDWVPPAELADIIFSLTQPERKSVQGALIPVSGRL